MGNIKSILNKQLELISPSKVDMEILNKKTKNILDILNKNIRKLKIKAEVFIGGSFAKNTLIKKKRYDVDIFIRFDKKYKEEELHKLLSRIVPREAICLHGSRDYYSLGGKEENIEFEIIPTIKVKYSSEARNITDLSYFHVSYVLGKVRKNRKLADEIKLAKSFIHAAGCYGAESYINGFSGYAVELLIIHYKNFTSLIKAIARANIEKKIIIDQEKLYRNKEEIMRNMNEAKILSPIIFIDPTFKERNVLSALSYETLSKFREFCIKFLKNPDEKLLETKDEAKEFSMKNRNKDIIHIEIKTNKQAGDIAGTKLKKFYNYLLSKVERYFDIKDSIFIYDDSLNIGKIMLVLETKKKILFSGPPIEMKEALALFKKEHRKIEIRKGQAFAYEKGYKNFKEFLLYFENKYSKVINEMDVDKLSLH